MRFGKNFRDIETNKKGDTSNDDEDATLALPPLPPINGEDDNKSDPVLVTDQKHIKGNAVDNDTKALLSTAGEIKIADKLMKKGKKAKKKVAHHINDKLSAIKKTQRMLKESMEQNKAGIDLILKSLTQQGVIST